MTAGGSKADNGYCELGNHWAPSVIEICNTVVTNALLALALAVVVALICARIQRPAIRHLLWVLVLLRLVVPPIYVVDLSAQRNRIQQMLADRVGRHAALRLTYREHLSVIRKATEHLGVLPIRTLYTDASGEEPSSVATTEAATPWMDFQAYLLRAWRFLTVLLQLAWITGSLACLAYQLIAVLRFHRRFHEQAYTSRIWQRRADGLAQRMGLARSPKVYMVRDAISPMLWGVGSRVRILLPDRLFERLNRRSQNGLLCHELAHFQRGDHWIRLLESIVMAIYWWHPVFWWARHEIEKSEEQCCDAIAVAQAFGHRRSYAEGLLNAVDFVNGASLPPTASGAIRNGILRQRIELIMLKRQGWADRKIGPGLMLIFAGALLPFPLFSNQLSKSTASASTLGIVADAPSITSETGHRTTIAPRAGKLRHAPECRLTTDACHRARLQTRNGSTVDLGVGRLSASAWAHSKDWVAIGTTDGKVAIRCAKNGERHLEFQCGNAAIAGLAFSAEDQALAVADHGGELFVMDASVGTRLLRVRESNASVIKLSFLHNGRLHAVWSKDGDLIEKTMRFDHRVTTLR